MKTISFVIPCYASEGSVALVMEEIRQTVAEKPEFDYEIVAVNDCSPDNVLSVLRQEAEADPKVKVIDLAKNGGRHCALMAGFHVTTGDYVVCIDDDLQCPTDQLWNLLAPLEAGDYDVSIARYAKKKQSAFKNFGSSVHNKVSDWLLGKDKNLRFSGTVHGFHGLLQTAFQAGKICFKRGGIRLFFGSDFPEQSGKGDEKQTDTYGGG